MARILVVDEDGLIRSTLRRLLALEGHDVVEAVGGLAAIELAVADPPDLVLCDLRMPDLDGAQVARHLRLDPRTSQVPVVILTGSGTTSQVHADAHVTKPFERDQLLAVISRLLKTGRG